MAQRNPTLEQRLFADPTAFDFFQTVFLLELLNSPAPGSRGRIEDLIRLKTFPSLSFPSSSVKHLRRRLHHSNKPHVFVNFLGLIGPQGALPLHYTLKVLDANRLVKEDDLFTSPLLEWLDLFNHRILSLFHQAWEKYRFPVTFFHLTRLQPPHESRESAYRRVTDDFTQALFSLIGMGIPSLRSRLLVETTEETPQQLGAVPDLALLRYAGNLARNPRHANGLESFLADYFGLPVKVNVLTGQWLHLDPGNQTQFTETSNCALGENVVAGERIWDFNSMFRLSLGPLNYSQFVDLLPDSSAIPERKTFFLLSQLTRYYVGSELDFDVQLRLWGNQVPECELAEPGPGQLGARLGWNTWLKGDIMPEIVEEAVFSGNDNPSLPETPAD